MPVDYYLLDNRDTCISVLRGVVSSDDLVAALSPPEPDFVARRTLVTFAPVGLFAVTLEGVCAALSKETRLERLGLVAFYAPTELAFGMARLLQSRIVPFLTRRVWVERQEANALAIIGLPQTEVNAVLPRCRKLVPDAKTPAPQ